jgi:hypothetical protein
MNSPRITKFIKYRVKRFIPKTFWFILARYTEEKRKSEFKQRHVKRGSAERENIVYVIRRRPPGGGLFSNVNHVLQGIEFAKSNDLTPIVDMQNYWTSYSQRRSLNNTKNAWEYFFEPVSQIKIGEVDQYKNVIFSKGDRILPASPLADLSLRFVLDSKILEKYHNLYIENIRLNKFAFDFINRVKEFIDWDHNSIGVSYRGTYYVSNQPSGHAKQPTLPHLISRLENKREKYSNCRLFISTEDNAAKKEIINSDFNSVYREFRDQSTLRKLISNHAPVSKQTIDALGYLAEIYLLSECLTITSSIANGSASALVINGGKYLEPDIIYIGNY